MKKETGGQAFPLHETHDYCASRGMTLRDYFAAQALTGAQIWDAVLNERNSNFASVGGVKELAVIAYAIADAMIEARQE